MNNCSSCMRGNWLLALVETEAAWICHRRKVYSFFFFVCSSACLQSVVRPLASRAAPHCVSSGWLAELMKLPLIWFPENDDISRRVFWFQSSFQSTCIGGGGVKKKKKIRRRKTIKTKKIKKKKTTNHRMINQKTEQIQPPTPPPQFRFCPLQIASLAPLTKCPPPQDVFFPKQKQNPPKALHFKFGMTKIALCFPMHTEVERKFSLSEGLH